MNVKYPIYRKYKEIDTWFRIDSERYFVEIKRIGDRYILTEIKADKFPEILLIKDMIKCKDGRWEKISSKDFLSILDKTV